MYSEHRLRRFVFMLLGALALFFVIREPNKAAVLATHAFNGLMAAADALVVFAANFG
ncbi:hypothetical protein HS048_03815 [Planomonospora sp. ID91781]|uniref:hypothetical protein n=1 Tax=Planomonospora sp. ID91781 TaxID=2738135 RepID=UPI0018C3B785|nr:hypothetical protein [Planomonospora sp. ID91781]MBG0819873.1 hypothetical protein [Planomonospora sp. ID91781]